MKIQELKAFFQEHPEVCSISLEGPRFPKWKWPFNRKDPECRSLWIRVNSKSVNVFFHKVRRNHRGNKRISTSPL